MIENLKWKKKHLVHLDVEEVIFLILEVKTHNPPIVRKIIVDEDEATVCV